jgi:hypothetical protein
MQVRSIAARVMGAAAIVLAGSAPAGAQAGAPAAHQHEHLAPQSQDPHAGHDMASMASMARDGSGTSWLPDASPMYAFHATRGRWQLMAHENLFLQYLHESGARGADQGGSINWFMGMASRPVGRGRLRLNGMVSLEPFTIPGCGYPDLLASGETCDGEAIHDRQHPHDLFMELSARYDAPLARGLRWEIYGGPAGEPALGPVAFPHRLSSMPNPIAPLSHHWLDATHVMFGVVTGGVYAPKWKAETSVFNGREPDEDRTDFDFGALDSVSARLTYLPVPAVALQVSAGRLAEAEAGEPGEPRATVRRTTASMTVHTGVRDGSIWATTVAWGRNVEEDHATNAFLVESNFTKRQRDTWFGRFEMTAKTAHDLALPDDGGDILTVAKLQGGYTRYFSPRGGFTPGLGGALSFGIVPEALAATYGRRVNTGAALFVTVRPAGRM